MNFENLQNNKENQKSSFEIMKTPEIVVHEEKGAQLFSLLLKAENSEWGETETSFAKETTEYFKENPLNLKTLETIREFHEQEVDEETLYNFSLTYQHPERVKEAFDMITKYKPHIKNPKEIHQKLQGILETFDQTFSNSSLAEKLTLEIETDREKRLEQEQLKTTKERVENIIDFFKPDLKTTSVKKLNFVPTDPLYKKNSGRTFLSFSDEQIIISHINNKDNQDHEFCHSIINPIVEKLSQKLTNEQKEKISQLANKRLKEDYGKEHFSLLCEEFIRTFDVVKKGGSPKSYEDFKQKLSKITSKQFQKELAENLNFQKRCKKMKITTISDLQKKSKEYFKQFENNPLQNLIFEFYQKYEKLPNQENKNFEQFVLDNFIDSI